mgnify:CR=1 FL=1
MIDEKKIEEAIEEIFENEFELYSDDIEYPSGNTYKMFTPDQLKRAISLGAHWAIQEFLNKMWHDVEEEPKRPSLILAYCINKAGKEYFDTFSSTSNENGWGRGYWNIHSHYYGIREWLYIDDIIPE